MKNIAFYALAGGILSAAVWAGSAARKDIVDTAVSAGSFKTLVAAVKRADLAGALKGEGPFTVFAPVDAAFAKLPKGTLDALLSDAGRGQLASILKLHVVPGRLNSSVLLSMGESATLNGETLRTTLDGGTIRVGEAAILTADIECANGVIHVIDRVLLPTSKTIPELARDAGSFKTLLKAVEAAGLAETLSGKGPFTVFAPTDAAFAKLPQDALAKLLRPENRESLRAVLGMHVISGRVTASEAILAREAKTLAGQSVKIAYRDGALRVGGASVVKADLVASNGVVHVIDSVLLPETGRTEASPARSILMLAIDRGVPLFNEGQVGACAAIYEIAARSLLDLGGEELTGGQREILSAAYNRAAKLHDMSARAWMLRRAFDRILAGEAEETMDAGLTAEPGFKPIIEASLPEGFPEPGPVGEVVVKEYPRYRAARTDGDRRAFGKLFFHIKKNKIAMTAPVEMSMSEGDGESLEQKDMAFLYATPELGRTGRDGNVEVLDLEPVRVLSVGLRGPMSDEKVAAARKAIERRVGADQRWQRDGEWRLMGYNSPMVPPARRFWELQLPVVERVTN